MDFFRASILVETESVDTTIQQGISGAHPPTIATEWPGNIC